jgi:cell division protein FtsQ
MRKLIEFLKYNKKWNIALWVIIGVFLTGALLAINGKENQLRVSGVDISIEPRELLSFLDSLKVIEILKGEDVERNLIGESRESINIDEMERSLESYPFIESADVSLDLSGKLIVKVIQRSPVLRIINSQLQSYYVAKSGYKMPMHTSFSPRVLIASGNIAETLTDSTGVQSQLLRDLLAIANFCAEDAFWHSQIEQIYVDNYMDILLIPKVGNHSIVFGSAENLEGKFERLKTFYLQGLNKIGWDAYSKINLKYDSQIVAERRDYVPPAPVVPPVSAPTNTN